MNTKKYYIVKLRGLRYIHIGTGREDYDTASDQLSSDSISAALAAIRCQQGKTADLKDFLDSFAISSAFPYDGDKYFLPTPLGKFNIKVHGQEEEQYRKKLKKIKFAEKNIWEQLIFGKEIIVEEPQIYGEFLLSKSVNADNDFTAPYMREIRQRVNVDLEKQNEPFYFEWTYFKENAGLFFLIDCHKDLLNELKSLFSTLGEYGIGSDKSFGGGMFHVDEIDSIDFSISDSPNAQMLLSTYLPTKEELKEIDLDNSKYRLVLRGGYIAGAEKDNHRHLHKKTIHLFQTSSVLSTLSDLHGDVADLTPAYIGVNKVYRSGRPILFPIKHN